MSFENVGDDVRLRRTRLSVLSVTIRATAGIQEQRRLGTIRSTMSAGKRGLKMARPREFDEDYVLEQALHVFWEKGYDSTSLADLQQVTGLMKSSLYKAFESKEGLFRRVVERYHRDHLGFRGQALAQATPKL